MTKRELIKAIAKGTGLTEEQAEEALSSFIEAIIVNLRKEKKISLPGLGTFSIVKQSARVGKNPQTGKAINIQAKNIIKFKQSGAVNMSLKKGKKNDGTDHTGPRRL
jgi:DNA-binding protein HU-beta